MTFHDYNARAELYLGSDHASAQAQGGREFRTTAHALRFALEEAAPVSLKGARLVVGGLAFSGAEMAALYNGPSYPLERKTLRGTSRQRPARRRLGLFKHLQSSVSGDRKPQWPTIARQSVGLATPRAMAPVAGATRLQ